MADNYLSNPNPESSNKRQKRLNKGEKKRTKSSWIWQYFKETTSKDENGVEIPIIVCQIKRKDGTSCDTKYNYTTQSTGNAIIHLRNLHEICKTGKIEVRT